MDIQPPFIPTAPAPTVNHRARYLQIILGLVLIGVIFSAGFTAGQTFYLKKTIVAGSSATDTVTQVTIDRNINRSNDLDFNQFWQVWDMVKSKYVKQPVKDSDLFYAAIQGLVAGLNDPYSVYFPPAAATDFNKSLAGEFDGIGAEIGVKSSQLVIIAPLPGTPAERAGLKPGDWILAIDKKPTTGMDTNTAVTNIRGPAATTVTLTIAREGWDKPRDIGVKREKINVPAVIFSMKPGNVAYLRIMQFNENSIPQFNKYIKTIQDNKATGLILDLRSNPGGYLESAVAMASEWIADGKIVSEKFSDKSENIHATQGDHRLVGMKTVVLINKGSASASEIVAGALQDYKAATIIGEQSYGKGSVQDYETLPDGSALKVTVAEWYTPKEHNINKTGITPDVAVVEDYTKEKVGQDAVIDKALLIISGK
jgi:carboxyl-terminal processing protease